MGLRNMWRNKALPRRESGNPYACFATSVTHETPLNRYGLWGLNARERARLLRSLLEGASQSVVKRKPRAYKIATAMIVAGLGLDMAGITPGKTGSALGTALYLGILAYTDTHQVAWALGRRLYNGVAPTTDSSAKLVKTGRRMGRVAAVFAACAGCWLGGHMFYTAHDSLSAYVQTKIKREPLLYPLKKPNLPSKTI